ncbi:Cyclophilin type peptidyl-prolyl cis-trans isomerase/CLD [Nesidiocoris tenuis]|uniref:Cyclophilin type peptidyl-prolyl cis-trans isomerase/CLD n=1 Tax=Nesidiocoris tenuis TaxID=355587 RepID=A0ABN7BED1_9HEMI|nr:Cyclophilin type peptidyl-prolyl cis-trans isomerase/CLD [Nesidiocoris tenuis]
MMDAVALKELEEMTFCGYCKQKFNDTDQIPKLLTCKHYFCLGCIPPMMKGLEVFCVNCWKRTELAEQGPETLPTYNPILQLAMNFTNMKLAPSKPPEKERKAVVSENCHRHGMPLALWCSTCGNAICRACATQTDHPSHQIRSHAEAKEQLISDVQVEMMAVSKLLQDITRLSNQQRGFLLQVLESCLTLKTHIETDLQNGWSQHVPEMGESRDLLANARIVLSKMDNPSEAQALFTSLNMEKQRLQAKVQDMYFQCQLDDLICNSIVVFDFALLKQALANIHTVDSNIQPRTGPNSPSNPLLFLTNYCMSQLYTRHMVSKQHIQQNGNVDYIKASPVTGAQYDMSLAVPGAVQQQQSLINVSRAPSNSYPLFFFNIEVNGQPHGRIVIETRPDVAPKMSKNFAVLSTGERGITYKGCTVFQCWEGESVITGDFESNNGRGGRSIYDEGYFMPDDTKFPAVRGAVGMRRTQKRHDNLGMVGSQFRVILQEMRGFTAIFGHVVEGIELVEKIASFSDQTGKPTKTVVIVNCGKL